MTELQNASVLCTGVDRSLIGVFLVPLGVYMALNPLGVVIIMSCHTQLITQKARH